MTPADKAMAEQLRQLRETYEREAKRLLDAHMAEHYGDRGGPLWRHAVRASIEVRSWPAWKRRAAYGQPERDE